MCGKVLTIARQALVGKSIKILESWWKVIGFQCKFPLDVSKLLVHPPWACHKEPWPSPGNPAGVHLRCHKTSLGDRYGTVGWALHHRGLSHVYSPYHSTNSSLNCPPSNPAPCQCIWKAVEDGPRAFPSATHMEDQDRVPGSQFQPGLALAVKAIGISLSLPHPLACSFSLSLYQIHTDCFIMTSIVSLMYNSFLQNFGFHWT